MLNKGWEHPVDLIGIRPFKFTMFTLMNVQFLRSHDRCLPDSITEDKTRWVDDLIEIGRCRDSDCSKEEL